MAAEAAAQKAAAEKAAKAAEDAQRAKALEAERKAAEEKRRAEAETAAARAAADKQAKAEQAERDRQAAEAAAQKAAAEKAAKAAEDAQRAKALEAERKAADEKRKAEAEAVAARAAAEKQAREAEEARKKAELAAAKEAACKSEQARLEAISAKGSDGTGLDDLKAFAKTVTCDRLGGLVVAALDTFKAEAAKRAATQPNSPELIRSAQAELIRLGCLTGKVDGALSAPTSAALSRYMKIGGQPTENVKRDRSAGHGTDQACDPGLPDRVQGRRDLEGRDLRRRQAGGSGGCRQAEERRRRCRLAPQAAAGRRVRSRRPSRSLRAPSSRRWRGRASSVAAAVVAATP